MEHCDKTIGTLIPDIQQLLERKDGWFSPELANRVSADIAMRVSAQLGKAENRPTLRLSKMGPQCPRALWHSIHTPELATPLPPWATFKFTFGHILESLAVSFAKAAGHSVEGEQLEVEVDGITGHLDGIFDGCVVDVKSCSSIQFQKYKSKSVATNDSFGYLDQLDGYLAGSIKNPLVKVKDRGYILAIDKTLGHMCLYEHYLREASIRQRISDYKAIIALAGPPPCTCETVSDGQSGNIALGVTASYSAFRHCCFPHLRTFLYANGPRYFSRVVKRPEYRGVPIIEVDKFNNVVYN